MGKQDMNKNSSKLTPKQRKFCMEYMIDYNGTQAAIRAGYSDKTAPQQASRLLSKADVVEYIDKLELKVLAKSIISAEQVLEGVSKIAEDKNEKTADRIRAYEFLGKHYDLTTSTTTRVEDWHTDAIEKIQDGLIDFEVMKQVCIEFGEDESLAEQLFKQAGIEVESSD